MRFGTPLRGSCITRKDAGYAGFAGSETSARADVTQPADFVATKINDFKE
ncbi:MAG: hypothetical protein PHD39_12370 [Methylobacter tundripaludum]|jgi:hypothetical protein|nr:hypothetical protein [Methylobacter tundripaludum]